MSSNAYRHLDCIDCAAVTVNCTEDWTKLFLNHLSCYFSQSEIYFSSSSKESFEKAKLLQFPDESQKFPSLSVVLI